MRLAIVTPWFGAELIGGAERLAWDLSRALVRAGADIEVLTTCCRSFHDDWAANYHRPGVTTVDGVVVRRFRVDARDRVAFTRANSALLALRRDQLKRDRAPLPHEQTDPFLTDNIRSSALVNHLKARGREYDAVLFLPYLYGTTIDGLPVVRERAALIPCLHDEPYAYLDGMRELFRQARGLLFNSEGEHDVAASLYGPWIHARAHVIGHAVDVVNPPSRQMTIKSFAPHSSRYLLFLGRGDRTKNLDLAVDAYIRFRQRRRTTALQFVVAGPHARHLRAFEGIVDLGAVTEEAKAALLVNARALVQPSTNESFSRTVYEAWQMKRPVVVHTDCTATANIVDESGGGWTARTVEEWADIFAMIDESSDASIDGAGLRGGGAALEGGTWDDVASRVLAAVVEYVGRPAGPRIEQIVPLGSQAASAYAAALDAALRAAGCETSISLERPTVGEGQTPLIRHVAVHGLAEPADAYIVHTPSADIPRDTPAFAASEEAARDLGQRSVPNRLLPSPVDPAQWAMAATRGPRYDDGAVNVVSIAPIGAAEAERLVEVFGRFRQRVHRARFLILDGTCTQAAHDALVILSLAIGLSDELLFVEGGTDATYTALRDAHVACAFGAPLMSADLLVTAMWFDLPLIAYEEEMTRAVASCGLLCDPDDPNEAAILLYLAATDRDLCVQMIAENRRVRQRYEPRAAAATMLEALLPHELAKRRTRVDCLPTFKVPSIRTKYS